MFSNTSSIRSTLWGPWRVCLFFLWDRWRKSKEPIQLLRSGTKQDLLSLTKIWLVDRTFALILEIFCQIYTIYFEFRAFSVTFILYCSQAKQQNLTNSLRYWVNNKQNPENVLVDFEKAPLIAWDRNLSNAEIRFYYFYPMQPFKRKISETGIETSDEKFLKLNFAPRTFPTLTHVPLGHVQEICQVVI